MSKHASAEDKLHVSPAYRNSAAKKRPVDGRSQPSPAPPKGTNANNQYR